MPLDDRIAAHNANVFVREFTYSSTQFKGQDGQERQLCDGAVWIGDLLILFQNKERNPAAVTGDPDAETSWFNKKVSKLAVGQLCDSLRYLQEERALPFANMRGQTLDLTKAKEQVSLTHLVALFSPSAILPAEVAMKKGRMSQRVGFVHFFTADDYVRVCATLHTPFEVSDYLSFRKAVALKDPNADAVSEKALLGQYLMDPAPDRSVSPNNEEYVDRLVRDADEFSLSSILAVYLDRVTFGVDGTDYHAILVELARLRRHMAREFRKRLAWAMEVCKGTSNLAQSRFHVPGLRCSYIFIPLDASQRDAWERDLKPLTYLSKHAFRSPKCIGLTVATDPNDSRYFLINWLYLEFPWEPDDRADELIRNTKPFRESAGVWTPVYRFEQR
jgi:hypothetical protein